MKVSVRTRARNGRFRAGLRLSREARIVDVSDEQLLALEADAMVTVEPVEEAAAVTPEPPPPAKHEPPSDRSVKHEPGERRGKR